MANAEILVTPPSETTDLERRVLAHEKILQALIAYMARTEPHFVDHLRERFVEPMKMVQHEHDYRDVNDYAEEFIRAVMRMGEERIQVKPVSPIVTKPGRFASDKLMQDRTPDWRDRVQVKQRNGIWEVKVDGVFHGDYHKKDQAVAAAALLKLSMR